MNSYRDTALQANDRRVYLQREAEQERLAQAATDGQPVVTDRVLATVGEWLIASGKRLKERADYRVPSARYGVLKEINT